MAMAATAAATDRESVRFMPQRSRRHAGAETTEHPRNRRTRPQDRPQDPRATGAEQLAQRGQQPVDVVLGGVRRQADPQPAGLAEAEVVRRLPGVEVAGRRVDVPLGQRDGHVGRARRPRTSPAPSASGASPASARRTGRCARPSSSRSRRPSSYASMAAYADREPAATVVAGAQRRQEVDRCRRARPSARRAACRARTAPAPGLVAGTSLSGSIVSSRARARRPARRSAGRGTCRASRRRSPRPARPGRWPTCAVWCTPSTYSSAPASWTAAAIAGRSGRVPIRFEAAVTATSRVSLGEQAR